MPTAFYIDVPRGVVFFKITGPVGLSDALAHVDRLLSHPEFRPEFNQLSDFREVVGPTLSSDQLRDLGKKTIFSKTSRRAFVVSSDLHYGLSRLFAAYRDLEGEKGIAIFREMKPALDWLSLIEEPDPKLYQ